MTTGHECSGSGCSFLPAEPKEPTEPSLRGRGRMNSPWRMRELYLDKSCYPFYIGTEQVTLTAVSGAGRNITTTRTEGGDMYRFSSPRHRSGTMQSSHTHPARQMRLLALGLGLLF